ncbi:chromate transporter [Treponema sp.]
MELLNLFIVFFRIGMVSFGGGWTIVGIIKDEVIRALWLTEAQFAEVVGLAQVTPGPVALNTATLVGYRTQGLLGAVVSTLAVVAFPILAIILVSFIARFIKLDKERLRAALRIGTMAMIAMTLFNLSISSALSLIGILVAIAAFAVSSFTRLNPLILIFSAGAIGAIIEIIL